VDNRHRDRINAVFWYGDAGPTDFALDVHKAAIREAAVERTEGLPFEGVLIASWVMVFSYASFDDVATGN
jgi:hypothetical protein